MTGPRTVISSDENPFSTSNATEREPLTHATSPSPRRHLERQKLVQRAQTDGARDPYRKSQQNRPVAGYITTQPATTRDRPASWRGISRPLLIIAFHDHRGSR